MQPTTIRGKNGAVHGSATVPEMPAGNGRSNGAMSADPVTKVTHDTHNATQQEITLSLCNSGSNVVYALAEALDGLMIHGHTLKADRDAHRVTVRFHYDLSNDVVESTARRVARRL